MKKKIVSSLALMMASTLSIADSSPIKLGETGYLGAGDMGKISIERLSKTPIGEIDCKIMNVYHEKFPVFISFTYGNGGMMTLNDQPVPPSKGSFYAVPLSGNAEDTLKIFSVMHVASSYVYNDYLQIQNGASGTIGHTIKVKDCYYVNPPENKANTSK